jgi:peptidoglycan/LPS O-acetylase OafA/YrhL
VSTVSQEATESHRSTPRPRFRGDVQGLRAIAVGLVVLDHARVPLFEGGFIGVDVFFVISGFLITGLLLEDARTRRRVSFVAFYARRAARILPAATVVIVFTDIASVLIMNFINARSVLTDSVWAAFFAANLHFASEGTSYFNPTGPVSPLQHLWSLAVEEQFYVVWPAILAIALFGLAALPGRRTAPAPAHRPKRLLRGRVALVLLVIFVVSLLLSISGTHTNAAAAYFSTVDRAYELAAGALLATLQPLIARIPSLIAAWSTWAGLALIAFGTFTFNAATPFPGADALVPVLGASAILAGGLRAPRNGANELLSRRPMQFVGNISYSLYLWHWPLLVLGSAYLGYVLNVWQNLVLVAMAVGLATASYYLVENPIRHAKVVRTRPKVALLLWPIALASIIVVALAAQPASPFGVAKNVIGSAHAAEKAVRVAVEAGLRGDPIPALLQPSLASAPYSFKSIGTCSAYGHTKSKLCEMGDPKGTHLIVLFGNSHSTMWVPAMRVVAQTDHWRFIPIVKEACDYQDYPMAGDNPCSEWYRWALTQIKRLHPDVVLIGNYVHKTWYKALPTIVTQMKPYVGHVVLMTDAPSIAMVPSDCLLQPGATQKTCLWPQNKKNLAAWPILKRIGTRYDVQVINNAPWFCWHDLCPSVIDTIIPYADTAHISGTYSKYLGPELGLALHLT